MSHFYAAIPTSARRTMPTARGHKSTGITVYAASWAGRIAVRLRHNAETGLDEFAVMMTPHEGEGDEHAIATGIVGNALSMTFNGDPNVAIA